MKTKYLIYLSAFFWLCVAIYNESKVLAGIAVATHVLIVFLHNIEVKVNRLLDHFGIRVSQRELDE